MGKPCQQRSPSIEETSASRVSLAKTVACFTNFDHHEFYQCPAFSPNGLETISKNGCTIRTCVKAYKYTYCLLSVVYSVRCKR